MLLNINSSPGLVVGLPQRRHLEHICLLGMEVPPKFVASSYRCCYFSLSGSLLGAMIQDALVQWELSFELAAGLF